MYEFSYLKKKIQPQFFNAVMKFISECFFWLGEVKLFSVSRRVISVWLHNQKLEL